MNLLDYGRWGNGRLEVRIIESEKWSPRKPLKAVHKIELEGKFKKPSQCTHRNGAVQRELTED